MLTWNRLEEDPRSSKPNVTTARLLHLSTTMRLEKRQMQIENGLRHLGKFFALKFKDRCVKSGYLKWIACGSIDSLKHKGSALSTGGYCADTWDTGVPESSCLIA
jgi:hypothetical protein